jgi:hypothetical protein
MVIFHDCENHDLTPLQKVCLSCPQLKISVKNQIQKDFSEGKWAFSSRFLAKNGESASHFQRGKILKILTL